MNISEIKQEYLFFLQEDNLINHNIEREWIYFGSNQIQEIKSDARQEKELINLNIVKINGIIANNEPILNLVKAGKKITPGTHGEVLHVTIEDGRRAVAKFSGSKYYNADMHFELRRGLEFERLGLTVIYGKTTHPVEGLFGFVMAPMGESLRHWQYPGSTPRTEWITAKTFSDLYTIFTRLEQSSVPHPDVQFGITQNGRLLLFDYDYQRVDESPEALSDFKNQLPAMMAHEFAIMANLVNSQNEYYLPKHSVSLNSLI